MLTLLFPALPWLLVLLLPKASGPRVRLPALLAMFVVILGADFERRSLEDCTDAQVGLAYIFAPIALVVASAAVFVVVAGLVAFVEVVSAWRSGAALERRWLLLAFGCATLLGTVWLGVGSVEDREMEARAGRTDVTPDSLQRVATWASDQGEENVLRMLAISIRASPELLRQLSTSRAEFVRGQVARHPACPEDVLATLAKDPAWSVREAVAEAPRATPAVLAALVHDPDAPVSQAATRALHRCPVDAGSAR